ncbi:MAG TPA: DUF2244 domain-containing protein [Steroidobacteraceae bacterium]
MSHVLLIQIAPNCSLRPLSASLFFGSLCLVSFGIAGVLAWHGMWPILPFAGLEMLLLGWALRVSLRRRNFSQTVVLSDDLVTVETRNGPVRQQFEFPRHWARVKLRLADTRWHPSRLTVESHGRTCEIGGFLTEEERRALAKRLMRSVGRVNESPPLVGAPE